VKVGYLIAKACNINFVGLVKGSNAQVGLVKCLDKQKPLLLVELGEFSHMMIPNDARAARKLYVVNGDHAKVFMVLKQSSADFFTENTSCNRLGGSLLQRAYTEKAGATG
jgi:hypothetical protein